MWMIRRLAAALSAPWRPRCKRCGGALAPPHVFVCAACMAEETDALVRQRLRELDANEAVALARGVALRDGERELAAALQAVLLVHLTGGSLATVTAPVRPEKRREAVN